ncbi:Microtubule bundling protein [Cystobasidiomycetes sp. EMM_F5]
MDLSTLSSLLENHALALEGLYRSLGADRAVVTVKLDELHQALIGTIQRQRTAAEQEVADVQRRVEELRSDIERNRRRLGEGRASCATDGETLLQTRVRLEKEAQVTEKVVQKRQKAIAALSDRLLALEAVVGQGFGGASYAHDTPTNAQAILPGSEQPLDLQTLANLEKAITKCENEVRHREELLQSLLREILDLWNELGLVPSSRSSQSTSNGPVLVTATASRADDLDHQILIALGLGMPGCESSTPKLTASRADTDRLENYKSELEAERDKRMLQIQTIYDELYLLWTRLGVSEDDADEFVEMWKGTEQKCIDAYRAELCRMLDVKAEHMGIFIQNEQQEIIALWEELFYADTDRARFPLMQAESASEDILIAHELERKRLVEEKQSKEPILRHLSRYFELLDEMQQLEANANDPSRLTAKGQRRDPGRLLREEKTRKRVAKDKPKVEQELLALIPAWEAQHNQAFMVNGSRFIEDLTARLNVEDAKASVNKSRTRHGSVTNLPGSRPLPLSAKRPLVSYASPLSTTYAYGIFRNISCLRVTDDTVSHFIFPSLSSAQFDVGAVGTRSSPLFDPPLSWPGLSRH